MMRWVFTFGAALLSVGCSATDDSTTLEAQPPEQEVSPLFGTRKTIVYAPANPEGLPLVVALHGCLQSAEDFLGATRLREAADRERFVVLAVEQSLFANPSRCWNWFYPINQTGSTGEPAIIINAIATTRAAYQLGPKTYVMGLSAGAAMAGILSVCRPDVIHGAMLHSGPKVSVWEACGGVSERRTIVVQGTDDTVVAEHNADAWWQHLYWMQDHADDGLFNSSLALTESTQTLVGKTVHSKRTYGLESLRIEDFPHAWSGGDPGFAFTAAGPDATAIAWEFFAR